MMTTAILSNYLENALINHILRNTAYATPGESVYVALFTANPGEAGDGAEVSGGAYARKQVTAWDAPDGGATENTNEITFDEATAAWGEVTHIGIMDALTGGHLLFAIELTDHRTVGSGSIFRLPAGAIDIALAGAYSTYLANALLSHILRNSAYTTPGTSIYVGLHTANPTAAGDGAEVSGGAYAREQITAWDEPSDGDTENTNLQAYDAATASWGTVTHFGIWNAATAGNLLFFGALTASKAVANGDIFQWAAGALDIAIS